MEEVGEISQFSQKDQYRQEENLVGHFNIKMGEPRFSDFIHGRGNIPEDKQRAYYRMDHNERAGLFAYINLPKNQHDRVTLLKRAQRQMDGSFGDTACVTLSEYLRHAKDIRLQWEEDWRQMLDYDEQRTPLDESTLNAMDTINLYLRVPPAGDRQSRLMNMLEIAVETNLINNEQRDEVLHRLESALHDAQFRDQALNMGYGDLLNALHGREETPTDTQQIYPAESYTKWGRDDRKDQGAAKRKWVDRNGKLIKKKDRNRDTLESSQAQRASRWQAEKDNRGNIIEARKNPPNENNQF